MANFSEQLIALQRKTNMKGADLAFELGIGESYLSQLKTGKKEPREHAPIRRVVERMLAAPDAEPGMRSIIVEVPERLYIAAVEASQAQSFPSVGEYVAQLIRSDTKHVAAVRTIQTGPQTEPRAQTVTGIRKSRASSAPKR